MINIETKNENFKSGFVAIIGRPSVGKSELLNALVGYKTSIVSPLPQTTRNAVRGICNSDKGQIIFLDSPGLHLSEKKFNQHMVSQSEFAIKEADVVLYLLDLTRLPREEEEKVANLLKDCGKPVIIALNKSDLSKKLQSKTAIQMFLNHFFPNSPKLTISALKQIGLDKLKDLILDVMPTGGLLYDEDIYTDQSPSFRIAEVLRESAIPYLHEEVPHSLYVEVADLEMQKKELWARCFLMVERENQKAFIIGKGGATLSLIRKRAMKSFGKIFPYPIKLELSVKVDKDWRKNSTRLNTLFKL